MSSCVGLIDSLTAINRLIERNPLISQLKIHWKFKLKKCFETEIFKMRPMSRTYYIGVLLITLNFDWGFERSFDYCGNCLHCILMYNSNCLLECIRANADITSYSLSCIKISVSLINGWIYTLEFKFFPEFKIFLTRCVFPLPFDYECKEK